MDIAISQNKINKALEFQLDFNRIFWVNKAEFVWKGRIKLKNKGERKKKEAKRYIKLAITIFTPPLR